MLNRICPITLVFINLLLFFMAADEAFADAPVELEQAKSSIISLIKEGNYAQAQTQTQKMIDDFPENPDLPKVIYNIAEGYRWSTRPDKDKYEYARIFYQQVIQSYPDSAYADKAALGISRGKVLSLIVSQDFDAAGQALDEMVASFPNHPNLPDELYWIARKYGWSERHEEEKAVYQQILQNYPDSPFADKARLGFSRAAVQSLVMSQDYDGAKKALDKLVADFSEHPDLHDALYWIAVRYVWSGRFEDAKRVYQQIIQNYPDSPSVSSARLGFSRADVLSLMMLQDYNRAKEALDKMIVDFSGHPDLPDAILTMGRQCYDEGISKESEGLADEAKDRFEKAAKIWDRLVNELPTSSLTAEACCWAGDCYLKLGKHQDSIRCFQKVVDDYPEYEYAWHAQFTVGRCYEELKDTGAVEESAADAQIKAAYERVIQNYPDCPAAGYVRHLLSREVEKEK